MISRHIDIGALAIATAEVMACEPSLPYEIAKQQAQTAGETAWDYLRYQSSNVLDVLKIVLRSLSAAPGKRILLMGSPGFVTGDMERQKGRLIDLCLRSNITVNALDDAV